MEPGSKWRNFWSMFYTGYAKHALYIVDTRRPDYTYNQKGDVARQMIVKIAKIPGFENRVLAVALWRQFKKTYPEHVKDKHHPDLVLKNLGWD